MIKLRLKSLHKIGMLLFSSLLVFAISIPLGGLFSTRDGMPDVTSAGNPACETQNAETEKEGTFESIVTESLISETSVPSDIPIAETDPVETEQTQAPLQFQAVSYTLYVDANKLNLRAEPTIESDILTQLKFGDKVVCEGENEAWMKVVYDGMIGYLKTEYTSKSMVFKSVNQIMFVDAGELNLRSEPTTESEILDKLVRNETLTRIGIGDEWSWVVTSSGMKGYVSSKYITNIPPFKEANWYSDYDYSNVTQEEIDLLIRIVALESSSKYGYKGYLATATVILNRVESARFGSTITAVLSAKNQFTTYNSTRTPSINSNVTSAVADALSGKRILPSYVMYFATPEAYSKSVAAGGSFSRLSVYGIAYGTAWCYKSSDR